MADGDETHEDGNPAPGITDEEPNMEDEAEDAIEELPISDMALSDDFCQEYTELNNTIDQLDLCLSSLEERNDNLFAKLQELLESSREARRELNEQKNSEGNENS